MLYALGPAQVADVHQAIDAVFDLNECAEVGQIANTSFHLLAHREFLMQAVPRVRGQLAHAERNAALAWIHIQYHALNLVADVD